MASTTPASIRLTRSVLPLTLEEISPAWLSSALSQRFPGVVVKSAHRASERAGTSTSARFILDYEAGEGHPGLPRSLYLKGGFDKDMRKRVWGALIQEARFYAELAPGVPVNIPRAYFAGVDEENRQGIVILEDLSERKVHFGHATDNVSVDTVAAIIEGQARLHAAFWDAPRLSQYRPWADPQRVFLSWLYRPKWWETVSARPYGKILADILPDPEFGLKALKTMWALNDQGPATLVHGDCHGGNLYFETDGRPGFMDWQCVFPGSPGHDHAEMILSILETEERRKNERQLIALYRDVLVKSGVRNAPSTEEFFLSYRRNAMHMMASSVFNPYDMQTEEVTNTTAMRTLQAAQDLDMLSALGLS